jgi:cholesterol transport system auxiliary component
MKKIFGLLMLSLFLVSCSIKVKNQNNTGYSYLLPKVNLTFNKSLSCINLDSVESNKLHNNYILYEADDKYDYFAYSKWINSPPTMLKDFILESVNYIKLDPYAKYRLKILLFDFEPHFNKTNNFFYFKARAFLYNSSFKLLSSKMFDYKVEFTQKTNESLLAAASKATEDFFRNLNEWLTGEVK